MISNQITDMKRSQHYAIHIGGVFASAQSVIVRTVLGSCISVCLRDPVTEVGGMNHFMLPVGQRDGQASAHYGVHAMELLINDCMHAGADRHRLEAKVFGGGHVLRVRESDGNVPQSNIRFALEFLDTENIPIIARDLGGYAAREIFYCTGTGHVRLRRLTDTQPETTQRLASLEQEERASLRTLAEQIKIDNTSVTLF